VQVRLLLRGFLLFFNKYVLLWVAVEDFTTIEILYFKNSYHNSIHTPMRPNELELWTHPDDGAARAQAPGCQRFKVQGEDPHTPGYLRGDGVRLGRRRSRIVGASPLARSR